MIRSKDKIYGELNDPETVEMATTSATKVWVASGSNKSIVRPTGGARRLLIADGNGNVAFLNLTGQTNKVIGTDANGNIVLLDRGVLND